MPVPCVQFFNDNLFSWEKKLNSWTLLKGPAWSSSVKYQPVPTPFSPFLDTLWVHYPSINSAKGQYYHLRAFAQVVAFPTALFFLPYEWPTPFSFSGTYLHVIFSDLFTWSHPPVFTALSPILCSSLLCFDYYQHCCILCEVGTKFVMFVMFVLVYPGPSIVLDK